MQAGGHPTYSAELSTAIGGYPLGAMLAKVSGFGFWRNITANNTTNPDSGGSGWISDSAGNYTNATVVTSSSTSLTALQSGQAFLFTTAGSSVVLPVSSSVIAGEIYKLHTSAGFTLSVAGGGAMQAGNASVTSLTILAGTEVLAVSSGSAWWVFGTGVQPDIYRRSNIVGTVSQSIGIPTGAIIERGSNANGSYVKFADGTMIVRGTKASPSDVAANSSDTILAQFPVVFSAGVIHAVSTYLGSQPVGVTSVGTISVDKLEIGRRNFLATPNSMAVMYTAIGSWF